MHLKKKSQDKGFKGVRKGDIEQKEEIMFLITLVPLEKLGRKGVKNKLQRQHLRLEEAVLLIVQSQYLTTGHYQVTLSPLGNNHAPE